MSILNLSTIHAIYRSTLDFLNYYIYFIDNHFCATNEFHISPCKKVKNEWIFLQTFQINNAGYFVQLIIKINNAY